MGRSGQNPTNNRQHPPGSGEALRLKHHEQPVWPWRTLTAPGITTWDSSCNCEGDAGGARCIEQGSWALALESIGGKTAGRAQTAPGEHACGLVHAAAPLLIAQSCLPAQKRAEPPLTRLPCQPRTRRQRTDSQPASRSLQSAASPPAAHIQVVDATTSNAGITVYTHTHRVPSNQQFLDSRLPPRTRISHLLHARKRADGQGAHSHKAGGRPPVAINLGCTARQGRAGQGRAGAALDACDANRGGASQRTCATATACPHLSQSPCRCGCPPQRRRCTSQWEGQRVHAEQPVVVMCGKRAMQPHCVTALAATNPSAAWQP